MPADADAPPSATDVRTTDLDPLGGLTADQQARLSGLRCAACGSSEILRDGGHAYTLMRGSRLGHAVKVCASCPQTAPR
ncbi:hypothetical protein [Streptomyces sp. NPDC001108]